MTENGTLREGLYPLTPAQPGEEALVPVTVTAVDLIGEPDHHCGVSLVYDTPQPFHIHTVLRTPHGNDYGRAYVRQWQEQKPS